MFGVKVRLRHLQFGSVTLRNVTEIHYNYDSVLGTKRTAFESDVHGTGITYDTSEILEFDARLETEKADEF